MASSLLGPVKNKFPEALITVICQSHVGEIYESNPNVSEVIKINLKDYNRVQYQISIADRLKSLNADLLINSIYSRTTQCDEIAGKCSAKIKLAFAGDTSNISPELLSKNNMLYTAFVNTKIEINNETERIKTFLEYLGIKTKIITPELKLLPQDIDFSNKVFNENNLSRKRQFVLLHTPSMMYAIIPVTQRLLKN